MKSPVEKDVSTATFGIVKRGEKTDPEDLRMTPSLTSTSKSEPKETTSIVADGKKRSLVQYFGSSDSDDDKTADVG